MGFRAINEDEPNGAKPTGETQEAKESRIVRAYEQALLLIAQGFDAEALVWLCPLKRF